jgi:hypothetical protein
MEIKTKIVTFTPIHPHHGQLMLINDEYYYPDVIKNNFNHLENCYVYFHIGNHNFDFWWSKSNTFETDILFVNKMQKMCGININFVDLSKVLSSMVEFSNKYPSLNINIKDRFEAFYQEYLYKLQETLQTGKETNQQ